MSDVQFTLNRFRTEDHLELVGLLSSSPDASSKGLLHVHGLSGNFYEQAFVDVIAKTGVENDRRVLLFNNRGHDYFSDSYIYDGSGRKSVGIGGARERVDAWAKDICAGLDFLERAGIRDVVITSHSTGAVKALIYAMQNDPRVTGVVMLSPSDDVGIQKSNLEDRFDSTLELAKSKLQAGNPEEMMPEGSFFYPVDAQAYVALFDPKSAGNVFDLEGHGPGLSPLASCNVPVLVMVGSEDIAFTSPDKQTAAQRLIQAFPHSAHNQAHVINGAGHDYFGHEREIGKLLSSWLTKL